MREKLTFRRAPIISFTAFVVLSSDAAHTIHPLAGQGLNQGQGDVESLAQTIEYAVRHGQDIGTLNGGLFFY